MFGRSQASWVLMLANHIYGYHPDAATTRIGDFKCLYCSETFFDRTRRMRHIDELHLEQMAAGVCPVCKESFTTPQLLYAHVDEKHPQVMNRQRTRACPLCPHMAFDMKAVRGHIDTCHANPNPTEHYGEIRCSLCGEQFTHPSKMWHHKRDRHRNASSANWDMKCDFCDFTTESSCGLLVHLQRKHGIMTGSVACVVQGCDSFFRKVGSRDRHARIAHRELFPKLQPLALEEDATM